MIKATKRRDGFKNGLKALAVAVVTGLLLLPSFGSANSAAKEDGKGTIVAVVKATRENLTRELIVQAEFRPYREIELHPKVAGYLERLDVDMGDQVQQGQAIATIEVPELDDDVTRAEAVVKRSEQEVFRAEASSEEARVAHERLQSVGKSQPNLIAQQDLDAARAKERVAASTLASSKEQVLVFRAEAKKLRTMIGYTRITAPFSGVITKRYADPGQIIQSGTGSSTQTTPLVRLSQMDRLRLSFPISMTYVPHVRVGEEVEVRVASVNKAFRAKISRFTHKIETATRTMDVEVDVPNSDLALFPGMYASAVLTLEHRDRVLSVPIQTVARGQSPTVLVINGRDLEERKVKLGLETPERVEILAGLNEGDLVAIGSRSQFKPGQKVEPKLIATEKE